MSTPIDLHSIAESALAQMRRHGFEHAQVSATVSALTELNVNHNEPSLMRSGEQHRLVLSGIVDARKASTELGEFAADAVRNRIESLLAEAKSAPRDEAHAMSAGQHADIVQGPQEADEALLADKVRELLAFRASETPRMTLDEAFASHTRVRSHTLTSGGSELSCSLGWYAMSVLGTAREGKRSSSFNYADGSTNDLGVLHASEQFGIGAMMRDTGRQIDTQPIEQKFVGDVVLSPHAVEDLMQWLHGQVSDLQLIAGSSLYRDKLGERIASPLLTLRSRFDAPGVAAISADGYATPPVHVLREGRLATLTPSLYGSRKTGLTHVPVAVGGWELAAGDTPLDQLVAAVPRGAIVGRLSMGNPAPNGDFSGVIKNSFLIEGGTLGPALSEVMIAGNIARMLRDVAGISRERLDRGAWLLPWLRVTGLSFS